MITLAIIGVLVGMAVAYSGEAHANVKSFAADLVGQADAARLRAVSTRRWNRIWFDYDAQRVVVEQSTTTGMAVPDDDEWEPVERTELPRVVHVASITQTSDVSTGNAVSDGDGIDDYLLFAPDGSSAARTVYLSEANGGAATRVVFYSATGTGYAKDGW
jgi:Tfp pilus assembly protein FimT